MATGTPKKGYRVMEKIRQDCKIVLALPDMPTEIEKKQIYLWWRSLSYRQRECVREIAEEWLIIENN
mgnify:CR=1 FL=1